MLGKLSERVRGDVVEPDAREVGLIPWILLQNDATAPVDCDVVEHVEAFGGLARLVAVEEQDSDVVAQLDQDVYRTVTCTGYVTLLQPMTDLELKGTPGDRRLYTLEGVGTLRLQGLASRTATAEAGGKSWTIARRGFWQRLIEATDASGTAVGEFEPRSLRRGGTLRWAGREFALRPASSWRERYALASDQRELAVLDGKGWGRRPVKITVDDPEAVEPGLLLFTSFIVRGLAENAGGGAGAGAATAATGG